MKTYRNGAILSVLVAMMVAGTAFGSANAATGIDIMLENDGNKVTVSGATGSSSSISMVITAPNGNFVAVGQIDSPDTQTMTYTTSFKVAGPNWAKDGIYTVTITQGTNEATAKIEATNGEIVRLFDFEGTYKDTEKMEHDMGHDMEHGTEDAMMEKQGLSIVDASQEGATMIMVTGNTDKTGEFDEITIIATAPNGNRVSVGQMSPNADGTFTIEMQVGGELGRQDGMYTISAQQGSGPQYTDEVMIEIVNGAVVPEFGSAAIIVLVVAIVSIVAITTRSRLSIQPRL